MFNDEFYAQNQGLAICNQLIALLLVDELIRRYNKKLANPSNNLTKREKNTFQQSFPTIFLSSKITV